MATVKPLTYAEHRTLASFCDALLPPDDSTWRESAPDRVAATLARLPDPGDLARLRRLLGMMESPSVNLLLAGKRARLSALDRPDRERYLQALATHPLNQIRGAFAAIKRLAAIAYYADSDSEGRNPVWPEMGYPGPLDTPPDVPRAIRPLSVERPATLECDAVIVGSGAGGGMVAAELARAGNDVIVVEKGGYYNEADFTQREVEMLRRLYLDGGLSASADQGVVIVAGSCLGGGTVVNYTTSFRTPDRVREEWARRSGLSFFTSPDFTRSLDAACERLHVNLDHNRPSSRDAIMARGLEACGWHVGRMPRDVRGCTQDDVCGYCGMGCVRGAKCSSLHALLPEAQGHGARMLVDTEAERVLMEGGRAVGILARTRAGNGLTVRARAVVAAAGAINSPALLLRSGLRSPVGEDLTLHPATPVWGLFDEEVRPWTGTLQALYSDQFADLDGGYGVKLETAPMHPALLGLACPWESAEDFERLMRGLSHASLIGILLRDRYGGRVRIGRGGLPVVNYRLSRYDQRHIRAGVEAAARVLQAAGAREILSAQNRPVSFKPGGESLEGWLARVDRVGYGANQMVYFSFHQMGTCRMGSRQRTSVVNGEGEVHTVKNLFVADGSLFPSASGVNPMVSISALAHYVAQHIKARL